MQKYKFLNARDFVPNHYTVLGILLKENIGTQEQDLILIAQQMVTKKSQRKTQQQNFGWGVAQKVDGGIDYGRFKFD